LHAIAGRHGGTHARLKIPSGEQASSHLEIYALELFV
jgi:hypothetical protein